MTLLRTCRSWLIWLLPISLLLLGLTLQTSPAPALDFPYTLGKAPPWGCAALGWNNPYEAAATACRVLQDGRQIDFVAYLGTSESIVYVFDDTSVGDVLLSLPTASKVEHINDQWDWTWELPKYTICLVAASHDPNTPAWYLVYTERQ